MKRLNSNAKTSVKDGCKNQRNLLLAEHLRIGSKGCVCQRSGETVYKVGYTQVAAEMTQLISFMDYFTLF